MQAIESDLFTRHVKLLIILALLVPIAISEAMAQQYSGDGVPSQIEEEIRWFVNRGRFDSAAENAAQKTSYSDVPSTASALAPNRQLTLAGRHHSEDMAKNNAFQHETVRGSTYYNSVTQPSPWDRMEAEGYNWNSAGENIAAGYNTAQAVYVGWWKSTGHRVNMYKANHREIGNGHFEWPSSTYRHYYTMDLASSANRSFLTGTLFNDSNGNKRYEASEAIGGIRVSLIVGDIAHPQYDVSTSVGSFAIPLQSIPAGSRVKVMLSSTVNTSVNLSMPTAYSTFYTVNLTPGGSIIYGEFIRGGSASNVGLREIIPIPASVPLPSLIVSATRLPSGAIERFTLSFPTASESSYTIEASTNTRTWQAIESGITGSGNIAMRSYPATNARKFYRLRRE